MGVLVFIALTLVAYIAIDFAVYKESIHKKNQQTE